MSVQKSTDSVLFFDLKSKGIKISKSSFHARIKTLVGPVGPAGLELCTSGLRILVILIKHHFDTPGLMDFAQKLQNKSLGRPKTLF